MNEDQKIGFLFRFPQNAALALGEVTLRFLLLGGSL